MGELINKNKLFLIMRNQKKEKFEKLVEAAYEGGIRLFEITFNPANENTEKDTAEAIEKIYKMYGKSVEVAAGTVVKPEYVKAASDAGATCIVSPNTDIRVGKLAHENGMIWCPGCYTPTEIYSAYNMGADVVKIFPILPNNIDYLKVILPTMKNIPFMPTGGVNPDTIPTFMELGASLLGTGVTILTKEAVENGDYKKITENAKVHIDIMRKYL